ncbi:hypothetical protein F0726_02910 [Acidithiobacillus caldus]|nr:hypothetical protein F0726_02910 [Acidithiobacillus caldus]
MLLACVRDPYPKHSNKRAIEDRDSDLHGGVVQHLE